MPYGYEEIIAPILIETVTDWRMFGLALLSLLISITALILTHIRYKRVEKQYQDEITRQNSERVRMEKVTVFKQLMSTRNIRDYERVKAINSIDIIFSDSKEVTEACVLYINNYKEYEANYNDASKKAVAEKAVTDSELKLLKNIAENLDFTNIDLSAIMHNSFQPRWLDERRSMDYYLLEMLEKALGSHDLAIANIGSSNNVAEKAKQLETSLCDACKNKMNNLSFVCKTCKPKIAALRK